MSQPGQPQWFWHQASQQWYRYDAQNDDLVFESGARVPRPGNVPRTAFASTSSQAAATPSPSSYTSNPVPLNPGYTSVAPGQQPYQQSSARPGAQSGPIAGPARSQTGYQDYARASSSQVDSLAQTLSGVNISTRQPQPVTPRVRFGNEGQRIVEAADPTTHLRTIIQTGPPKDITDPALLQSGIFARSRLLPSDNEVTERLFKSFRLRDQPRKFFTVGKVFLVLWVEPAGESNTGVTGLEVGTTIGRFGERAFSKVRRFVVVREGVNYCSALPVTSYGNRGVGKPGVNKSEHSIIYTTKHPPEPLPAELPIREEDGMRPNPIRVDTDDPIDKLDILSRLDYGKVHTIQHNIKVKAFGKVNPNSMFALTNQFGNVWRASPTGQASVSRGLEDVGQPKTAVRGSVASQRGPSMHSARVASDAGATSLQAASVAERAPAEADRAAVLQTDVRAAVQALVQQGHTEAQAERAIREELTRRRQDHGSAPRPNSVEEDDDDSSDDDEDDEDDEDDDEADTGQRSGGSQQREQGQRQQPGSSQTRSGSTQQPSTRTPASSHGTSGGAAAHIQAPTRSTGASMSSQAQSQTNRAQAEAMMARLIHEGKSRDEALAIIRARFGSSRSS